MARFSGPLITEKLTDDLWKVVEPFTFFPDGFICVMVPKNLVSDFASIPEIFWNLLPKDGTYDQSAVVHDYCYTLKDRPRKECDQIFLQGMKTLGVGWWTRGTMYNALRLFGWIAWNNKPEPLPRPVL